MVMVIVFLICWSPYASLALATILGYAQVHLISKMHALYTVFCVLRARQRTHMKMFMGWGSYMVNYETGPNTKSRPSTIQFCKKKINSNS